MPLLEIVGDELSFRSLHIRMSNPPSHQLSVPLPLYFLTRTCIVISVISHPGKQNDELIAQSRRLSIPPSLLSSPHITRRSTTTEGDERREFPFEDTAFHSSASRRRRRSGVVELPLIDRREQAGSLLSLDDEWRNLTVLISTHTTNTTIEAGR